jgi:hypothetical protein
MVKTQRGEWLVGVVCVYTYITVVYIYYVLHVQMYICKYM